jgi:hypothetical protein
MGLVPPSALLPSQGSIPSQEPLTKATEAVALQPRIFAPGFIDRTSIDLCARIPPDAL